MKNPFNTEEIKGLPYSVIDRACGFILIRDSKDFWIVYFEAVEGIRQEFYQAYRAVEPITGKKEAWAVNNKRLGSPDHGFRTLADAIEAIEKYREGATP